MRAQNLPSRSRDIAKARRVLIAFPGTPEICHNSDRDRKMTPSICRSIMSIIGFSLLLWIPTGCREKVSVPTNSPAQPATKSPPDSAPPAVTPSAIPSSKPAALESTPVPKVVVAPTDFDLAIATFKEGNYGKAAQYFDEYLRSNSNTENRDAALFHLGLSRAMLGNSGRSARRAEDALKHLVTDYPNSPYKGPADFILGLLGLQAQIENLKSDIKEKEIKIKQLSEELQKLKEIDMQRRPSSPLE